MSSILVPISANLHETYKTGEKTVLNKLTSQKLQDKVREAIAMDKLANVVRQ